MSYAPQGNYQMPQYGARPTSAGYGAPPPPQGGYYPPQGQPPQGSYPPQGQPQGQYGGAPPPGPYAAQYSQAPPPGPYGQGPPGQYPPQQGGYGAQYSNAPPGPQGPPPGASAARQWFDAVDADRSGKIDARELQSALSAGGFNFSATVTEQLMRMFDTDRSGQLSFMEFQQAHEFIQRMSGAFRTRDRDGSGMLEGNEVREALQASGYQITEGTFQLMMKKFDTRQQGGLSFDDYISLSIMLGRSRNVFAFYDRQRSGQVMFNFDSFLTAALTLH